MSAARRRTAGLALLLPLALFGAGVGALMTWHHDVWLYGPGGGELVGCSESAQVNCDVVNTSEHSELLGVPIATFGIGFYLIVFALSVAALKGLAGARAALMLMGLGAVGYSGFLYWVSTQQLGFVCAWCMRLYAVNTGILVLSSLGGRPRAPGGGLLVGGGLGALGLMLAVVGAERVYRASLIGADAVQVAAAAGPRGDADPSGTAVPAQIPVKTEDGREALLQITEDDAWTGARDAAVTVVAFEDLECGYCKRMSAELHRLEDTYGDRVRFVFKHFPMDPACNPGVKTRKHRDACLASRAAVCAQRQGRFWAFHDIAFKNQHELGAEALAAYAARVGVEPGAFEACLADPSSLAAVREDAEHGAAIDIHGTPRVFINGVLYRSGSSAEVMARAIEAALGADPKEAAARAAALREVRAPIAPIPPDVPPHRSLELDGLRFTIDTFEASRVDGVAQSARHAVPALRVSWFDAKAACEAAGRRLCTEAEWLSACQGARAVDDDQDGVFGDDLIEGSSYPYGDFHEKGRCWDGQDADTSRPAYTGELPGCASAGGVYDLTGNVEEWAGATPETAVLMGGAFDTSADHARCARRNDTFGPGYASPRTGFRCCG